MLLLSIFISRTHSQIMATTRTSNSSTNVSQTSFLYFFYDPLVLTDWTHSWHREHPWWPITKLAVKTWPITRKVNKTFQRIRNIVLKDMNGKVVNRATIQPFKDRELKTQRNDNCYIFQHHQQSDYRATLIFALYQVD